jgi:small-conductance mechanosensitive channel
MDINEALNLLSDKLYEWIKVLIAMLPNIVLAAFVVVFGIFITKLIRKVSLRLIRKISSIETINSLFASLVYTVSLGVVIFVMLSVLNLDKAVTSILAGAGILGLALAFAFQDIAANFMLGIFLLFRRPLAVGDIVSTNDHMGVVEEINLRDTMIRTFQGQRVIIPNKDVFQNTIENYTVLGKRRLDLGVGVSYGDDLRKVKEIAIKAAEKISVRSLTGVFQFCKIGKKS